MQLHVAKGLRGHHILQYHCPGTAQTSQHACQDPIALGIHLKCIPNFSYFHRYVPPPAWPTAFELECVPLKNAFHLLSPVFASGKALLWRLVKAIQLLGSITIKYCNYLSGYLQQSLTLSPQEVRRLLSLGKVNCC